MASISTNSKNDRRIMFRGPDGKRRSLWVGKASMRQAETLRVLVDALLKASRTGHTPDEAVCVKINALHRSIRDKLVKFGLLDPPDKPIATPLGEFVTNFVSLRRKAKPATKEIWRQGELSLLEFFGADCPLDSVTPGDADEYLEHLGGVTSRIKKPLAPMTIQKRLRFAKMIFRAARRKKLIPENPFEDVTYAATKPDKGFFITAEMTSRLLAACPDHHWRMIVVLCRYGGLRCPSEVLSLRWEDIDWDAGRMRVQSPKTEHHPGKESRVIPIFPELLGQLRESFEAAPTAVFVVDSRYRTSAMGKSGWKNCNMRTQFERIVKNAGLKKWPRLFHNLRSSRQTELAEVFPSHVVCAWLGNSEDIAKKHYYQVTDAHFAAASAGPGMAVAPSARDDETTSAHFDAPVAQILTQHAAAPESTKLQETSEPLGAEGVCAVSCIDLPIPAKPQDGWGGIRTHEPLSRLPVFKTGAFNRSATHPETGHRVGDDPGPPALHARF
jgi:integrase